MTTLAGVDVGGTFTDAYVVDAAGSTRSGKAPTTPDIVTGVVEALKEVISIGQIDSLAFGSTIATNALVQRTLAKTGLLGTAGFRDLLDLRRLWRPHLFGHTWSKPPAIVPRRLRLEARGRIDWRGEEIEPLAEEDVVLAAQQFKRAGVEAVAVSFLFSYLCPDHERRAAEILGEELPGVPVMASSEINPERHEYERTSTTVIAGGLAPIVDRALRDAEANLSEQGLGSPLRVMKSNGGVMSASAARNRPVELVKSGPAGGASAGVLLSAALGEPDLILLDIGGTTADASVVVGGRPLRADHDAIEWDIPIRVPVVDIRSLGAGGGSIAHLDPAGGLRVGPRSAGAVPGPAAYGKGGTEPTVTDAAIVSGLLDPGYFLAGAMELDTSAAEDALQPIAATLDFSLPRTAAAVIQVATTEMAALVREITVDRGRDPRDFALVAFGGAGPLFVGLLMDELDIRRGFVPSGAAILSAMGGALADVMFDYVRSLVGLLEQVEPSEVDAAFEGLLEQARSDVDVEGLEEARYLTSVDLRYAGQWHEIEVLHEPGADLRNTAELFELEHERLWGHRRSEDPIELIAIRVRAVATLPKPKIPAPPDVDDSRAKGERTAFFFGSERGVRTPVFERDALGAEWSAQGALIIEEPQTTTVVRPGQRARVGRHGELVLERR